ncbi:MAG: hypothetical protein RL026_268 [Pseudomonadota bacterium]|jgi:single-stranded-DNA-specific exonuclease
MTTRSMAELLQQRAAAAVPSPAPAPASGRRLIRRRAVPEATGLAGLSPLLARVFAARGVREPGELRLAPDRLLPVGTLGGAEAAAALLERHRDGRILVVGDYDADGATSTALLLRALRSWGFSAVDYLVPDRFRFGYGLTPAIVDVAAGRNPTLLVTVDNGIASHEGVQRARELGLQVLVTDHHLPGAVLPAAEVIVNPNVAGNGFGSRALAGVGVAFYVLLALRRRLQAAGRLPPGAAQATELLDLVALGTVADVVPLDANNRVLVALGLQRIREGRCRPGIRALLEVAGREAATLVAADLGFAVAPRLNAAGRLEDMGVGIDCLLAEDAAEARRLAERLDGINRERRRIEADMQAEAVAAVRGIDLPGRGERRHGLCLFDPGWHQGVVGLVAGRIKERLRRPVIAFARAEEGWLRGSARSVDGVHIRDVLDAVATREPGLVERFGGHAMAAGLTLAEAHLDRFARAFECECARWMEAVSAADHIATDGELLPAEFSLETARQLREAGPWGQAFPEPSFDGVFQVLQTRVVGERHLKLWVQPPGLRLRLEAVHFGYFDTPERPVPEGPVQLVYRLDVNHYGGEQRLQLLVEHLQAPD